MMLATHTDACAGIVMEDLETTHALRGNRVRTARRRIAEGWYDREELWDAVLEAILRNMTPRR